MNTLYKYNIDIVLNTFNQREESERKDSRILSESDPDILITKCVPSPKTSEKQWKINQRMLLCKTIFLVTMALVDLSMGYPLVSRKIFVLIPLNTWTFTVYFRLCSVNTVKFEKAPIKHVKQLPYGTDGKGVSNVMFNPERCFQSSKMVEVG